MKRKYWLMAVAGALVVSTVIGGTLAALNTTTEGAAGAATVGISVSDIGIQKVEEGQYSVTPGGTIECPRYVENSASALGYSIYTKVVINKYWTTKVQSANAEIVEGEYLDTSSDGYDVILANGVTYNQTANSTGQYVTDGNWLVSYADDEQIVLYYTKPVAPGEKTTNFIDEIRFSEAMNNKYADTSYWISYEITAVQANNSDAAIASELGVFAQFDNNGNITSISETK